MSGKQTIVVNGFEFTQSEIVSVTIKRNGVETFLQVPKAEQGKIGFAAALSSTSLLPASQGGRDERREGGSGEGATGDEGPAEELF